MIIRNILISGATGFVGKNLMPYLQKSIDGSIVVPLSIRYGDTFMTNANIYIHLAGKAHDINNFVNDEEYEKANYLLTRSFYDKFLEDKKASCFIYMSSIKAIADKPNSIIVDEDYQETIKTIYGISKKKAEEYILNKIPNDKRVYVLRPCMIHGPGNKGNLNLLYGFVRKGIPYPLSAFQNQRSFLSVENLCYVVDQLIRRTNIASGIYHVSDDTPVSTNRIIELISEISDRRSLMIPIPPILIRSIAKLGDILSLPINSHLLQKLTENYVVSNKKLVTAIGQKLPIEAEEGLRKTISSFVHAD